MKLKHPSNLGPHRRSSGFTLAEIMTAMAVFSLMVVGVVYSHVLGLKMYNISATKLGASAGARKALNQVRDELRSAKIFYIGNGGSAGFSRISGNAVREGNAVQIYPTANTNNFIRYYADTEAKALMRVTSAGGQPTVVSPFITNSLAFRAEDYAGNVLSNDQNNRVVRMTLEFYQWEFPVAHVGAYYDYYRLQTRITRRTIE